MVEKVRRPLAVAAMALGAALALVSAGPLGWGLGCLIGTGLGVGGYAVLTTPAGEAI